MPTQEQKLNTQQMTEVELRKKLAELQKEKERLKKLGAKLKEKK